MRTGIAYIPLDYGKCPRWLFEKMVRLGRLIAEAVVYEFGPEEFVSRLANPFFFQSLGAVLGFDWNSSGLTTTVCGALKEALRGTERDLGIFVAGGKGKTSRKTPSQIEEFGLRFGFDFTPRLIYASKMSAKVDSAALQDGFQLYHHTFFFTKSGFWTVIQQGMNIDLLKARRYHWQSDLIKDPSTNSGNNPSTSSGNNHSTSPHTKFGVMASSGYNFIEEPQAAICSDVKVKPLNLVAKESRQTRDYSVGLIKENFNTLLADLKKISEKGIKQPALPFDSAPRSGNILSEQNQRPIFLTLPSDEQSPPPILPFDYKRVEKILFEAREKNPQNFEDLLAQTSVGPKTLRALALVSEIIYGAKPSYQDPVRYSFAHGGKDGYPYSVDRQRYEESINILEKAISKAKLGQKEKLETFRRLAI